MYRYLLAFFATSLLYPPAIASAQPSDMAQQFRKLIECNTTHYRPTKGSFEVDKFNAAWESCSHIREEVLDTVPENEKPIWIDRFEKMKTSFIDRFQPQPEQPGHGLNPKDPIMIGGLRKGPSRTYAYFKKLRDEQGRPIEVRRIGSCCRFKTPNAIIGDHAALDKYEISSDNFASVTTVYVNIYDEGEVKPVEGFSLADDA